MNEPNRETEISFFPEIIFFILVFILSFSKKQFCNFCCHTESCRLDLPPIRQKHQILSIFTVESFLFSVKYFDKSSSKVTF